MRPGVLMAIGKDAVETVLAAVVAAVLADRRA